MTEATVGRLRQYKRLPVYIEEDHNEVLRCIHRAIGSRHLPVSGVTMVHLDSHPDLLLPLHLQADHVFDPQCLYSELSIENWILPLVYAGHISEIYWLKAPWADQLSDVSGRRFTVGKHKETGEIRTTLDDPYFLTEALYAPDSQLTDTKQAVLHVITVAPSCWGSEATCPGKQTVRSWDEPATVHSAGDSQTEHWTKQLKKDCHSHTSGSSEIEKRPNIKLQSDDHCEIHTEEGIQAKHSTEHCSPPRAKIKKIDDSEGTVCDPLNRTYCSVDAKSTLATELTFGTNEFLDKNWVQELRQKLAGQPYILDIDLDFFSTKDPFQNECSVDQKALLLQLFEFQLPTEKSEKMCQQFSEARQMQLDELHGVFQQLHQHPGCVPTVCNPHRQRVLDKLIQLLPQAASQEGPAVDYELLYRAGCTFDGSSLPHHVTSPHHIRQLVHCTAQLLRLLPPPTIITMARSSVDDYCPMDQVDMIQESMLQALNDIYNNLDVQKLYEEQQ